MGYVTDGTVGVDLTKVTAGTTTDGAGAEFALGTICNGTDNQRYVYCQAGAAISTTLKEPYFLCIDENFQAVKGTKALVAAGHLMGWAPQQIIADNAFFWAVLRGANFNGRVAPSCAADVLLYTTATAGLLDDTSGATHIPIMGVKLVVLASASTSAGNTIRELIVTEMVAKPQGMV